MRVRLPIDCSLTTWDDAFLREGTKEKHDGLLIASQPYRCFDWKKKKIWSIPYGRVPSGSAEPSTAP